MNSNKEKSYIGDIIRQELPNFASRGVGTILSGQVLKRGAVLGAVLFGAAVAAAFSLNAANTGTVGAVTVSDGAKPGVYKVVIIEPVTNAGKFTVEDPDGVTIGTGNVAAVFNGGGLSFTVSDGATDFISGEGFNITVAAGSGKYKLAPETSTDGSDAGTAILLEDVDATAGDVPNVLILLREAQVDATSLIYDASVNDDTKKTAIQAGLTAKGIQLLRAA